MSLNSMKIHLNAGALDLCERQTWTLQIIPIQSATMQRQQHWNTAKQENWQIVNKQPFSS